MKNLIEAIKLLEKETLRLDRQLVGRNYYGDLKITNVHTRENMMSHMKSYRNAVEILRRNIDEIDKG